MATLQKIIAAYLYQQYQDDEDLLAFVKVFNQMSQDYLDTFNNLELPIYTRDPVAGELLDWVAEGLYGLARPVLPTTAVDDDLFRRVITWHVLKGDGRVFWIRWLKRRVAQFLFGTNGVSFNVDQTYRISVIQDAAQNVTIRIINNLITVQGGAVYGAPLLNDFAYDEMLYTLQPYTPIPEAALLQQAMQSGILEMPFQFTFTVTQGGFADISL